MMEGRAVELSAGVDREGKYIFVPRHSQICGENGFLFSFDKIISPCAR